MPDENNKKAYSPAVLGGVIVLSALLIILAFAIGARIFGNEDGWICSGGKWARHGNPDAPAPNTECPGKTNNGNDDNGGEPEDEPEDEPEQSPEGNIRVSEPKQGDEIGMPVIIKGQARVFENTFTYRVKDADGKILIEKNAMTSAPDAGIFGNFEISSNYIVPETETGIVEVFEYSAKDGSETNMVRVPVKFGKIETMKVKVYFGNSKLDPGALDCSKVFSVERDIPKTEALARAALTELLFGLRTEEVDDGYFTSLNDGVVIQKLTIEDKTARVDFNGQLELSVGGSCRVAAIRAQITETLKQFPTVENVIISIDGRTEDILQP
ncbi:MAG: Gmad2 immunoglobulin-like domain-containing protein [Patescibacteria group bacterium]|jgi:hypothetical protein